MDALAIHSLSRQIRSARLLASRKALVGLKVEIADGFGNAFRNPSLSCGGKCGVPIGITPSWAVRQEAGRAVGARGVGRGGEGVGGRAGGGVGWRDPSS